MSREPAELSLKSAWNQVEIPVVLRRGGKGQKLRIRLPYAEDNRHWLQAGRRTAAVWLKEHQYWEVPKAWFNGFVEDALDRHGFLYVVQPYREEEKCATACLNATGHECQCSCMGANHGAGNDGRWFEVSETFAIRWGEQQLACRLMVRKHAR